MIASGCGANALSRAEAENMLGPEGKRCKKCNPLVIELDASDNEQ